MVWGPFNSGNQLFKVFAVNAVSNKRTRSKENTNNKNIYRAIMMTMEKTSRCELETFAKLLHLRNRKHVPCFYRVIETRGSLGEREMLWEHE